MELGYTLSSEEHGPLALIDAAARAEDLGFSFASISDHFHPWVDAQGQSPFVWSTLGGIAHATTSLPVGVGVCCPILRIHPAIVAHAAATTAVMLPGRFFLGVGTGELLNEHVLAQAWPRIEHRRAMLLEAVELMRRLWTGTVVDHDGRYFQVDNAARLYTVPDSPPPIVMSGFGPESAVAAAEAGCGLWTTGPDQELVDAYRGGGDGDVVGQLSLCWADDREAALDIVQEVWPISGLAGQLSQELPSPALFEQACATVRREDVARSVTCGADVDPIVKALDEYRRAGFTRVHLHQIGHDQEPFFEAWQGELGDECRRRYG